MGQTPSNRRREGRNAFDPNVLPNELNPWLNEKKDAYMVDVHARDWMDGWNEAHEEYVQSLHAEEQTQLMEEEEAEESYQRYLTNKARYDEEH